MNLVVLLVTICNLACVFATYALLRSFSSSRMRRTILDPATFILTLNIVFLIDFLLLCSDQSSAYELFERHQSLSRSVVIDSFGIFTAFQFVFLVAVAVVSQLPLQERAEPKAGEAASDVSWLTILMRPSDGTLRLFMLLSMCLYLPCVLLYIWQSRGTNLSHQMMLRQNPILDVVITMIIPMFAYYGTFSRRYRELLILAAVILITLAVAGKRGPVLAVGLTTLASLYRFKLSVPRHALLVLGPMLVCFLLTQRFLFRESFRHDSIGSFTQAKGGILNVFFSTAEVSNAEVLSSVAANQALLSRSPKDWLTSSILAPIPRSIVTFKPWGGSAHATQILSPDRWKLTRSEVLVTGYGDLVIHFGILGGLFVFGLIALCWSWSLRKTLLVDGNLNVFAFVFLVWAYYTFMRGDAFNLSRHIWFYLITWTGACLLVQTRLAVPDLRLPLPSIRTNTHDR